MGFGSGGSKFGSGAGDIAGNLSVTGTATITGDLTVDTSTLFVDASEDKVGIGTTSPSVTLDVIGIISAALDDDSLSQGVIQIGVDSGGDPGGELLFHTDDYVGIRCANSGASPFVVKPSGNVGIGTTSPNANAILDLTSTTKPFMPPRMTEAERDAVSSPTAGMVIYNSTDDVLNFHDGESWGAV